MLQRQLGPGHGAVVRPAAQVPRELSALRQARSEVDVADTALSRLDEPEAGQARGNLLVYGPAAMLAVLIQVAFALLADARTREHLEWLQHNTGDDHCSL